MLKNKLTLSLLLATSLLSSNVFANKITFPADSTDGNFYCTVNTRVPLFKTVDIHTDGVKVNGFCEGQEYVKQSGHVTGMLMSELKKYYFQYNKKVGKKGSVEIVAADDDDVTCTIGKGEERKVYGNGEFC